MIGNSPAPGESKLVFLGGGRHLFIHSTSVCIYGQFMYDLLVFKILSHLAIITERTADTKRAESRTIKSNVLLAALGIT